MASWFVPALGDSGGGFRVLAPLVILGIGAFVLSRGLAVSRLDLGLAAVAAFAVFLLAFLRTELGLYLVVVSMLLSPEFGARGSGLAESRQVVFRSEDFLLLVIALSWLAKTAMNKEIGLVLKTPLNRPIFVYVAVTAMTTTLGYLSGSVRTAAGFFYVLKYVEYFFVYYMVVNNIATRRQVRRLVVVAFLTAAVVSVIGIMQIPSAERVSAPFEGEAGEPNTLGGYLLLVMGVALGIALETRAMGTRLAMLGLCALCLAPFTFTLSRASYLAFPFMVLTAALLSRRRQVAVALIVGLLVLSPLVLYLTPEVVVKRIQYTFEPEAGSPTVKLGRVAFDPSTSARVRSMQQAWDGWQRSPLFGYGVTGFMFMDAQYARTLVESGLVGLAALGWLLLTLVRTGLGTYRAARDPDDRGLALGFLAATVALLIHAVGSNTFIIIRIMEPFWLFAGVIVLLPVVEANEPDAPAPGRPRGFERAWTR